MVSKRILVSLLLLSIISPSSSGYAGKEQVSLMVDHEKSERPTGGGSSKWSKKQVGVGVGTAVGALALGVGTFFAVTHSLGHREDSPLAPTGGSNSSLLPHSGTAGDLNRTVDPTSPRCIGSEYFDKDACGALRSDLKSPFLEDYYNDSSRAGYLRNVSQVSWNNYKLDIFIFLELPQTKPPSFPSNGKSMSLQHAHGAFPRWDGTFPGEQDGKGSMLRRLSCIKDKVGTEKEKEALQMAISVLSESKGTADDIKNAWKSIPKRFHRLFFSSVVLSENSPLVCEFLKTSGRVAPGSRPAFDELSAQDPGSPAFIGEKGREKRALAHSRGTSLLGFVSLLSNVRSTGSSDLKYPAKPKSSLRDRQLENKSRRDANPPKYSKNARGKR